MTNSLNFSALPSDASARFMRFEFCGEASADCGTLTPVAYVKEWQWPRAKNDNSVPEYRTVRISEHRWPLHKSTFMCKGPAADAVEWPPPPAPMSRAMLAYEDLLTPCWAYVPDTGDTPCLEMQPEDCFIAQEHIIDGNPEPNDGLPPNYLDFWRNGGDDAGA